MNAGQQFSARPVRSGLRFESEHALTNLEKVNMEPREVIEVAIQIVVVVFALGVFMACLHPVIRPVVKYIEDKRQAKVDERERKAKVDERERKAKVERWMSGKKPDWR
jgi:flagellar biosynthesis/type III secretory pathway M-ring protein FliF/YscJ